MTCKDCIHHEPCFEYGNILDPLGGGVKCDSFKNKADYVEVVRCKDCKHYIPNDKLDNDEYPNPIQADGLCGGIDKYTDETDFCSYGERKNDFKE